MPPQNIHVIVRIRPLNAQEKKSKKIKRAIKVVRTGVDDRDLDLSPNRVPGAGGLVQVELPNDVRLPTVNSTKKSNGKIDKTYKQYHPAVAFPPSSTQQEVFHSSNLPSLINHSMNGYRTTFFAYGQTGAGKTFTVLGEDKKPGLLFRAVNYLFKSTKLKSENEKMKFTIRLSAIELYNEQCFDLLTTGHARMKPLQVREHNKQGYYVDRLTGIRCINVNQCIHTIKGAVRQRTVGGHQMNARSSRSHLMITLYVDGTYLASTGASTFGRITIVDLAGSERLKDTRSGNVKESGFINKSLYTLGKVINGIAKNGGTLLPGTTRRHNQNIPFRESVLTKLLVQSLGGENMCAMCACVSPGNHVTGETVRTLGFAMMVKGIMNHPSIHIDEQEKLVTDLKKEIEKLKRENIQLKHMVIEVSQEASLASTKSGAQNHLGLVSEIDHLVGGTGTKVLQNGGDGDDDGEEYFQFDDDFEEEEEENNISYDDEYDEEEGEEEKINFPTISSRYNEPSPSPSPPISPISSAPSSPHSPSLFPTAPSPMKSNIDTSQRVVQLKAMLTEAKMQFQSDGNEIHPHILQLENELEDLQKELQLSAQLAGLGVSLEDSGEDPDGKQQRALEAMIAATMSTAAGDGDGDGDIDGDGESDGESDEEEKYSEQQYYSEGSGSIPSSPITPNPNNNSNVSNTSGRSNPFNWDESQGEGENWRNMWENSLRILADVDEGDAAAKLKQLELLERGGVNLFGDSKKKTTTKKTKTKKKNRRK
ncbi:hypothetical protein TrLO_g9197 [Triparma laevis f. longispina]|uniref:Kinesin-like protein n=1 Tax=Triparma laevis f. longispina TaxID=1714387 RepID=A0A9W7KVL2_9STRA|nr:hypothetical protein TrLO_g9197 [Triparma laevis f. longispina]